MEFTGLPGFDIEADLAPLAALHNAMASSSNQAQNAPTPSNTLPDFQFPSTLDDNTFPPPLGLNGNRANPDQKVFFITNCGSLLGRTIAQVALDRGHYVAACAREKHLADLSVRSDFCEEVDCLVISDRLSGYLCADRM